MSIDEIINVYESVVKVIDNNATNQDSRSYGGMIRSVKGKLQEYISEEIIKIAWHNLGKNANRLTINAKKIKLPIRDNYINNIANDKVRNFIKKHKDEYYYGLSVDKHVFIDNIFVAGIECKAYTENAMIKRILIDFSLLKTMYPDISCYLFQLESQLGGDYSALPNVVFGSKSTHSIMSYFENVDLHIVTFLQGERMIGRPIHQYFKPLDRDILMNTIALIQDDLKQYI